MVNKEKIDNEQVEAAPENESVDNALVECEAQLQGWKDKFLQVNADLQNLRKRTAKEQISWSQSAQARVLMPLLEVIDNFDRAMVEKPKTEDEESAAWIDGISMIHASLLKTLDQFNVKAMDNYDAFDPTFHEALMQIESDEKESGEIVVVLQKGYMMGDTVLRPAKVSVAR